MRTRRAIVRYSLDGLRDALRLPADTVVHQIVNDAERPDMLTLVVEGPSCPIVHEGEAYPWVAVEDL